MHYDLYLPLYITEPTFSYEIATEVAEKAVYGYVRKLIKEKKTRENSLKPPPAIRGVKFKSMQPEIHYNALKLTTLTINCDWFEVSGNCKAKFIYIDYDAMDKFKANNTEIQDASVKLDEVINQYFYELSEKENLTAVFKKGGTKVFKRIFELRVGEDVVAHLFTHPRFVEHMPEGTVSLQMANNLLYTKDWTQVYKMLVKNIGMVVNNISRLDIAIDGVNGMIKYLTNYTKQNEGFEEILRVGRARLSPLNFKDKNFTYTGFNIGSRSSDKYMVVYQKSVELKISGKQYIIDFWEKSGLKNENVERIEIRLNNKYLSTIKFIDQDYSVLENPNVLARIYEQSIKKYFDFRYNTCKSNIAFCDKIELIPFNQFSFEPLIRCKPVKMDAKYRAKITVKHSFEQVVKEYVTGEQKQANMTFIKQTLALYNMTDWYEEMKEYWIKEYQCSNRTGHIYELRSLNQNN